jgi:MFS family permease
MLSAFKNANLRWFFFADIISQFGSGMSLFALSWHVMATSGRNTSVATLIVANVVASLLFQPLGGLIADSYSRRSVLININWLRALGMALAIVAYSLVQSDVAVFALGAISGAGWSLFFPASRAFIQEIASEHERISGNAVLEVSLQAGFFSSVFVAGFLYKYLGFSAIIWVDIFTFVGSNLFLMRIPSSFGGVRLARSGVLAQFREGVEYLVQRKRLFSLGLSLFFPFIATVGFNAVAPGYVEFTLRGDSRVFGILETGYPIGACIAGLMAGYLAHRIRPQFLTPLLFVMSFSSLIGFIANEGLGIAVFLCFVFGFCNSAIRILMYTRLMEVVPSAVFSRITSLLSTAAAIVQVVVTLSIGQIMDATGVVGGFVVLASIMAAGLCLYVVGGLWSFQKSQGYSPDGTVSDAVADLPSTPRSTRAA